MTSAGTLSVGELRSTENSGYCGRVSITRSVSTTIPPLLAKCSRVVGVAAERRRPEAAAGFSMEVRGCESSSRTPCATSWSRIVSRKVSYPMRFPVPSQMTLPKQDTGS